MGKLLLTDVAFYDNDQLLNVIDRIVSPLGRHVDEANPMVDARLADGSRVNAVIAPLSLKGPVLTIRKFSRNPLTIENLIGFGSLNFKMAAFLEACVKGRTEYRRLRRYRQWKNDAAECSFRLHSL